MGAGAGEALLAALVGHLQSLVTPQAPHPLVVDLPAGLAGVRGGASPSPPRAPAGEVTKELAQPLLVVIDDRLCFDVTRGSRARRRPTDWEALTSLASEGSLLVDDAAVRSVGASFVYWCAIEGQVFEVPLEHLVDAYWNDDSGAGKGRCRCV